MADIKLNFTAIDETNPNDRFKYLANVAQVAYRESRYATAVSVTTQTAAKNYIGVTDTAAPRTITLSDVNKVDGQWYVIKDESGQADSTNYIEIVPESGTLDGVASIIINKANGAIGVYSDGTDWFIFDFYQSVDRFVYRDSTFFEAGSSLPARSVVGGTLSTLNFNINGHSIVWTENLPNFVAGSNINLVLVWCAGVNTGTVIWEASYGIQPIPGARVTSFSTPVSSGAVTVPGTTFDWTTTVLSFPAPAYDSNKLISFKVARNGGSVGNQVPNFLGLTINWEP